MELGFLVLRQTALMFLLMAVGYICYKLKLITDAGSKDIGHILIRLSIPAVMLKSFFVEYSSERVQNLFIAILLSITGLVLSMIVCHIIYGSRQRLNNFGSSFSNAGFIGIPLVTAALGNEAVFYVSPFVAGINILQQTYGIYVMTGKTDTIMPKNIIKNPSVIVFVLGMILYVLQVPIPWLVSEGVNYVASLNTPLAMFSLGIYLAQCKLGEVISSTSLYTPSLIRLILIPLLTIAVFTLLPADIFIKMTVLIAASAPIGSNTAIFAQLNGLDYSYGARLVCNCTILSIITLPIIVMIASMLWA